MSWLSPISYPTSANGIIVLSKTPPKYRKLDETKNKNAPKVIRLLTTFAEDGVMAHIP